MFNFSEPQSGFRIAFNMFDTDANHRVDKNEFLVVRIIIAHNVTKLLLKLVHCCVYSYVVPTYFITRNAVIQRLN